MNIFKQLFPSLRKRNRMEGELKHVKVKEGSRGFFVELEPNGVSEAIARHHEQVEKSRKNIEGIVKENATEVGWFSENINWMFIQEAGQYLSPRGGDKKHVVMLTDVNRYAQNVEIVSFECTNAIYSEWVKCCCDTMWHTRQKVLEDMHGNRYPVGDLCEVACTIKYI
jgi:hypothetical protein